jgi:methylmalonyl-CoA mutase N-terminal domain/subunit
VRPFDLRIDGGSMTGRRLARNIQNLLAEECAAGVVGDPAGGAFYVERRTEDLAESAWRLFGEWERAGGFFAVCASGGLRAAVDERWRARQTRLLAVQESILGVNAYRTADRRMPHVDPFDAHAFVDGWRSRLGRSGSDAQRVSSLPVWPRRYLDSDFEPLVGPAADLPSRGGPASGSRDLDVLS